VKPPFDRPLVQSCRRRHPPSSYGAGRNVPFLLRDGRSLEQISRGGDFSQTACGRERWQHRHAMSASKDASIDVALTRGQEQHCEGPNLRSAAAAASRGQVVRVREIAESGTSPPKIQPAMHDPRRTALAETGAWRKTAGTAVGSRLSASRWPIAARRNVEAGSSGAGCPRQRGTTGRR
jgi:hypothetical protein